MTKSIFPSSFWIYLFLIPFHLKAQYAELNYSPGHIQSGINKLGSTGRVLYVAAHPDDENTRLLAYLANERHYETAYLSLTRGDGGQNLIGTEQGEDLGIIRTQELIAARKRDGAKQFFTRAYDFGYSKNPEETFLKWGKDPVLEDVVWTIRMFQPDIIITRFPTTGEGGHGHHTASAILALEAFKAAADPAKFPHQLKYTKVWAAKRIFWNSFMPSRNPDADLTGLIKLDVGAWNPLLGASIGEVASDSRSQHKSQGFGVQNVRGPILEYFTLLDGEPCVSDIMEGVITNWSRYDASGKIEQTIQLLKKEFKPGDTQAILKPLCNLYSSIEALDNFPHKAEKLNEIKLLLLQTTGLYLELTSRTFSLSAKQKHTIRLEAINRSTSNITLHSIQFKGKTAGEVISQVLTENVLFKKEIDFELSKDVAFSNPYWLRKERNNDLFDVPNIETRHLAQMHNGIDGNLKVEIEGLMLDYPLSLDYKWVDPVKGELIRQTEVVPQVVAKISEPILLFQAGSKHQIKLTLESGADTIAGNIHIEIPEFVECEIISKSFSLGKTQKVQEIIFEVSTTSTRMLRDDQRSEISFSIDVNGVKDPLYVVNRIEYDHIPIQTRIQEAQITAVFVNLIKSDLEIAYLTGAGDDVGKCLIKCGYKVTDLDANHITFEKLQKFDAVVIGIRAFNTLNNAAEWMPAMLKYVNQGGTLIEQYNTKNWISDVALNPGPFPLTISRLRVTDETAAVKILEKEHPVLNFPNTIGTRDFEGWVQERGLYFPEKWDDAYTPLLEMADPGETSLRGSLLVANYGKGKFIYTGLSFFRQLPAGVPGAYRLFSNMLEWGRTDGKQ